MAKKHPVTLGVVCLARKTYDWQTAGEIYRKVKDDLMQIEAVNWVFIEDLVIEVDEARNAAEALAAKNVDGFVCISGTFHLGHLVLEIEMRGRFVEQVERATRGTASEFLGEFDALGFSAR